MTELYTYTTIGHHLEPQYLQKPTILTIRMDTRCSRKSIYIHACMHASIHPSVHLSVRPSVHPSVRPSIHPSIHPYIYIYICLVCTCVQPNVLHSMRHRVILGMSVRLSASKKITMVIVEPINNKQVALLVLKILG